MKLILSAILVALSAQASAKPLIHLESQLIENNTHLNDPYIICLGNAQAWAGTDFKVASRLGRLLVDYPHVFSTMEGKGENCIAPQRIPKEALSKFDQLLNLIDENNKDNVVVSVSIPKDIELDLAPNLASEEDLNAKAKEFISPTSLKPLPYQDSSLLWKLARAELIVLPAQLATMTALAMLPYEATLWEPGWQAKMPQNIYRGLTTPPVMDKDHWATNFIAHPVSGQFYYSTLRSQGATRFQSFLFSVFQSTVAWEYGIEAAAEIPSLQDLAYTPIIGSFMGELAHMATMEMRKNGFNTREKIIVTIINPAYVMINGYETKELAQP